MVALPVVLTPACAAVMHLRQIEAVLESVRPAYEPYGDYLSMVIEMGYLTLFAGA